MNNLDHAYWFEIARNLFILTAATIGLAFLATRWIRSAAWQRNIWQIAFVSVGILSLSEISGVTKGVALWVGGKKPEPRKFTVRTFAPAAPVVSLPIPEGSLSIPAEQPIGSPTIHEDTSVVWPGLVWIIGAAVILSRVLFSQTLLLGFRLRRQRLSEDGVVEAACRLAERLGLSRNVALRQSPALRSPIAFGIIRKTIVLPENFSKMFTPAQRDAVLAHELAHLAFNDPFWYLVADFVAALFWWNPLIWLARTKLHSTSEDAADEASLLVNDGATTLAECLVHLAKQFASKGAFGWTSIEGNGYRSNLALRVQRLLTLDNSEWRAPRRTAVVALKVFIPVLLTTLVIVSSAFAQRDKTQPGNLNSAIHQAWNDSVGALALNSVAPSGDSTIADRAITPIPSTVPTTINTNGVSANTKQENESTRMSIEMNQLKDVPREIVLVKHRIDLMERTHQNLKDPQFDTVTKFSFLSTLKNELQQDLQKSSANVSSAGAPVIVVVPSDSATAEDRKWEEVDKEQRSLKRRYAELLTQKYRPDDPKMVALTKQIQATDRLLEAELETALHRFEIEQRSLKEKLTQLESKLPAYNEISRRQATSTNTNPSEKAAEAATRALTPPISNGRQKILTKLERIRLEQFSNNGLPLGELLKDLVDRSIKGDPSHVGINFMIDGTNEIIVPQFQLRDVNLSEVLGAIVAASNEKIQYSIQDYAVVFATNSPTYSAPGLVTRVFRVDLSFPETMKGLGLIEGELTSKTPATNRTAILNGALLKYFTAAGIDFGPPNYLFFNDRTGNLMLRGTQKDLEVAVAAIEVLNAAPPQLTIETRFAEISDSDIKALGFDWFLKAGTNSFANIFTSSTNSPTVRVGDMSVTNSTGVTITGILNETQMRTVIRALENHQGVDLLTAPRVTTLSGRQAQVSSLDLVTVVNGFSAVKAPDGTQTNSYSTTTLPFGPVLDAIPYVSPDGLSIRMQLVATINEFLGYDKPNKEVEKAAPNSLKSGQLPLPRIRSRQVSTVAHVWDGQTIVLGGLISEEVRKVKDKVAVLGDVPLVGKLFQKESVTSVKKNLIIFVTPTVVDPAGNRAHTTEEMQHLLQKQPAAFQAPPATSASTGMRYLEPMSISEFRGGKHSK